MARIRAAVAASRPASSPPDSTACSRAGSVKGRCPVKSTAAETMFVHVNSLRYRIRRIEELTGRDLGSLEDQAALLLALRLAEER